MIREVCLKDAKDIAEIYNTYIEQTTITFETSPVNEEEMRKRIQDISAHYPYFVYEKNGEIIGYCYAHKWKEKKAYNHTAETTIYLKRNQCGKGIGKELMNTLIDACKEKGIHALIACITVPNEASVKLHESLGFQQVSRFYEVGYIRNIQGIFDKSGVFPFHSFTLRVLIYSPSQVMFAAIHNLVCGRQAFKRSSSIFAFR